MPRGRKKKEAASGEGYPHQEPGQQQGQRGPQGGQQQQGQRGPQGGQEQLGQRGPQGGQQQQGQRNPQGGQQQQGQRGPQGGQEQLGQRGPQGGQQQQGQRNPQGGQQQQGQRGPQGGQQQQGQRNPQGGQQWQGQRGSQGVQQQQGQRGPQGGQQQQGQRGPQRGQQQQGQRGPEGPPPGEAKNPWNKGLPPRAPAPSEVLTGSAASEVSAAPAKPAWGTKPQSSDPKPASESQQKGKGREQREAASSRQDPVQQAPKQTPRRGDGGAKRPDKGGAQDKKSPASQDFSLEASLKNLSFGPQSKDALTVSLKKPPGTLCTKKFGIRVNFLEIALNMKSPKKYHYDVEIDPAKPKCNFPIIIQQFMEESFPRHRYAFDGNKNVYTSQPLEFDGAVTKKITITDPDRAPHNNQREYSVTIKLAREIDLSVLHEQYLRGGTVNDGMQLAVQCLEIIFKGNSASGNVIQSGRGFFNPYVTHDIKQGKIIKPGFSHSVVLGTKIFLNIDVIYKIFPKSGPIISDLLKEVLAPPQRFRDQPPPRFDMPRELNEYQRRDLEEFLKGLKVEFKIPGRPDTVRKYRVNGLKESAAKKKFKLDDGRIISVQDYFAQEKGYVLHYPDLPCVWVGNRDRDVCLPIELCDIVENQSKRFRQNENDIRDIAKYATCNTIKRSDNIMNAVKNIGFEKNQYLHDFGVAVASEFKQVDGRILIHPTLEYNNKNVNVVKGEWKPETFKGGKSINNWAILVLDRRVRADEIRAFKTNIIKMAKELGMEISQQCEEVVKDIRPQELERQLEGIFNNFYQKKTQIIFVVIMDNKDMYSRVKKIGETKVGVLTQCIKARTVQRSGDMSILKNILLKVNIKLNGLNHTIKPVKQLLDNNQWCILKPTMILGADVTHPAPQDKQTIPSVAAVVANHDRHASAYNMEWNFQNPEVRDHEIIQDLKEMVSQQLKFYIEKNGTKPERLLFFRDGVSDGQIDEVRYREVRAVKEACLTVCGSYLPLTFMIVQKRHHTRFFPTRPNDKSVIYDQRNYNVPAGTVVDTEIVRQDMFEFYLVSHTSILGTARPTKYKIIWDECGITADEIQHLTYYLCHMFNRCTRAVSYPAPTYYAHLACFRIRNYLLTERYFKMDKLKDEKKRLQARLSLSAANPSFFI